MPTLTQLEYIVAVDTYRHFGIAAQKCFVTQPTLSMQIRKAEEELGVQLFDRTKQPIVPTDIGIELIQQARVVLREMQRMNELIGDFQNDVSGQLRVGIIPTIAPYLLPLFVGEFTRRYPKIQLLVRELTTEILLDALRNDLLDVGVLATPLHDEQIREMPLFYEEIKLYLHQNHALLAQNRVSVELLSGAEMWLLSQGHCFRNQVVNLCALAPSDQHQLPFSYESGSLEGLRRLVEREGGCTLLPELAVQGEQDRVRSLEPTPLREVGLVYVRNFAKRRMLQLLAEQIKRSVPAPMLDPARGQIVEWKR